MSQFMLFWKVCLTLLMVGAILLVDLPLLKSEAKTSQVVLYGSLTGVGAFLFALFTIMFSWQSPLPVLEVWFQPMESWLGL